MALVTKIVKEIRFEGVWGRVRSKKLIPETIFREYLRHSSFRAKLRTTGKVQFLFFNGFLLVMTKFSFSPGDWALGYYSMKF